MNSLFDDPGRKSNCCALSCCGVCLYDRTNFLVTGTRPNWGCRCLILFVPWILIVVLGTVSSMNQLACAEQYDETTDPTGYNDCLTSNAGTRLFSEVAAPVVLMLVVLGICILGGTQHGDLRVAVHKKMRAQRGDTQELSFPEYSQIREPTCCCSCYRQDIVDSLVTGDGDTSTAAIPEDDLHDTPSSSPDLSTCLFKTWTSLCFGFLCNCWCMCCGMCAIGQEDRELELIYQKENNSEALRIDYITFQPYSEYYPNIQMLQRSGDMSFKSHYMALSLLSKRIVRWAIRVMVLMVFTSFLDGSGGYKALVNLGVWAQPVLVLYFVWWKSNRFVISLDSVIKYFASGYIIGILEASIVEILMSIPFMVIGVVTLVMETWETNINREDVQGIIKEHMGVWALFVFFFSFGVFAFVEEIVKYYCYWTVETPDQLDTTNNKSKVDQAKFVTIAMVSAALGFACKENMLYVFQSPNIRDEAAVLLLRSLLAVHPVCAAIQALGVVRRDVQGDPTSSLGWALLPAIILHGSFDFFLLFNNLFLEDWGTLPDDTTSTTTDDISTPSVTLDEVVKEGGIGLFFMIAGLAYFFWQYRKQQKQLDVDDSTNSFQMTSLHVVEDEPMDHDSPTSPIIAV